MINLRINFSRLTKKLILIFICFYPVIVFSAENELLKIIEKNWNETNTMVGRFNQLLDNNETVAGNFFIHKPYQSRWFLDIMIEAPMNLCGFRCEAFCLPSVWRSLIRSTRAGKQRHCGMVPIPSLTK